MRNAGELLVQAEVHERNSDAHEKGQLTLPVGVCNCVILLCMICLCISFFSLHVRVVVYMFHHAIACVTYMWLCFDGVLVFFNAHPPTDYVRRCDAVGTSAGRRNLASGALSWQERSIRVPRDERRQ